MYIYIYHRLGFRLACLRAYNMYIHIMYTYIHTYIHTYMYIYIHTYIHTHILYRLGFRLACLRARTLVERERAGERCMYVPHMSYVLYLSHIIIWDIHTYIERAGERARECQNASARARVWVLDFSPFR